MKKKLLMYLLMLFIIADILVGFGWVFTHYVFVGASFYPRDAKLLDLRQEAVSVHKYQTLSEKLPECRILWNVPLHDGTIPNTEREVTVSSLTDEDVEALGCMEDLKKVEARSCDDYAQLHRLLTENPDTEVIYNVPIAGKKYSQDAVRVTASGLTAEDAENMAYLPDLEQVWVSDCDDYELLQSLQQENPQWNLEYTVSLGGREFASNAVSVQISDATAQEVASSMKGFTALKKMTLTNPKAELYELLDLRARNPEVDLSWQVEICGITADESTTELDLSGILLYSPDEVEPLANLLPNLEKLIMSDCGIDNETMAAFRERARDRYKVVWTVYLSDKAKCRTDDTYFMPIQQGEYYLLDKHTVNLKYCEDMVCIDVGHHKIYNIDFVAYMPKLKYLVIAHTEVQDVSPIVNCQELVYLEVDWSTIKDYTPIAQLKKLEDLNLNQTYCDLTPIMEMTWLKNLWMPGRGYEWGQKVTEALPNTRVVLVDTHAPGEGWRNLQNYYDMRDFLGMHYMK
jgi:hypothetical protein